MKKQSKTDLCQILLNEKKNEKDVSFLKALTMVRLAPLACRIRQIYQGVA